MNWHELMHVEMEPRGRLGQPDYRHYMIHRILYSMGSNSRGDAGAYFWHIDTPFFRHVNILERIR